MVTVGILVGNYEINFWLLTEPIFLIEVVTLLQNIKFEVVSPYIFLIKLARTVFILEKVHRSYWVIVKKFRLAVELFTGY
jgi:hypothetical protein